MRARLAVIAQIPGEWRDAVVAWRKVNAVLRDGSAAAPAAPASHAMTRGPDIPAAAASGPDAVEEYLIYQTLAGTWPISLERLGGYLLKAMREGKRTTNWIDPDEAHEAAVQQFAERLLGHQPFLETFVPFAERLARLARPVMLSQALLRLTSPGLPDVYQGDELETLALVDPDNRRPVDWDLRRRALAALRGGAEPDEATLKLHLTHRALVLRNERPETFAPGAAYAALDAGTDVCAYTRGEQIMTVVPLRIAAADGTELSVPDTLAGRWRDVLTGAEQRLEGRAPVERLLAPYGIGLLERIG